MFTILTKLIEESAYVKFSGVHGRGVSDEWIEKAERALRFDLPPSYKWWLKAYGGGSIHGDEIFTIYEIDFDEAAPGDIVYVARTNEKNNLFSRDQLFVCDPGTDEAWYFDMTQRDENGEYPVYFYDYTDGSSHLYAKNFAEFLERRIIQG